MKRVFSIVLALALVLALASCGGTAVGSNNANNAAPANNSNNAAPADNTVPSGDKQEPEAKKTLVVVFSATGTTKGVAEKIAAITGADIYEIKAAQEYTNADLNWHDNNSRTTKEQNDKSARPAIASEKIDLSGYGRIFIGYPIWWGEEPRIMDTFVESYDFSGITMIPFCTSGSSGIGRSGRNLADNAKSGNWLDGKRFGGSASESSIKDWISGLK